MSAADLALHVYVRQEIHLDPALALTATCFAATAGHVEGEASWFVAALARFRQHREDVADLGEDTGVGRGVRPRGAPDRRLVDADDLVDLLSTGKRFVRARLLPRAIQLAGQRGIEDVIDER